MTRISTKELMKACSSANAKAPARGDSAAGQIWVRGQPVPAPDGSVALRLADGSTAVVLAKDVTEADRGDDGTFGIATAMHTDILVVRAQVRRAFEISAGRDSGCSCSGSDAVAMARPIGWGGLGGCIAHCNALEGFCMGSGPGISFFTATVTVDDLQDALTHGAHCRDIWGGCASRCLDQTFSR